MRKELITTIKRAIVLYVVKNEGKKYKGDNSYNLKYIKDSEKIPDHRKKDIEKLDDMMKEEDGDLNSDISLCFDIYSYLKSIKTGFKLFWLFQIDTSSSMRDGIHDAMFIHDPNLLEACKKGTTGNYRRNSENPPEPSTKVPDDDDDDDLIELYAQLKKDHNSLKNDNVKLKDDVKDLKAKLSKEEMKNAILMDSINQLTFSNEELKKKLDKFLKKNGAARTMDPGIQMTATPRNKTAANPINNGNLPGQVPLRAAP